MALERRRDGWSEYSPAKTVAYHHGAVIRNITPTELAHHMFILPGDGVQTLVVRAAADPKATHIAAAFAQNAVGRYIGHVQWNASTPHVCALRVPTNDTTLATLLVDHAIVSMPACKQGTQRAGVSPFCTGQNMSDAQVKAVRDTCARNVGMPMSHHVYSRLISDGAIRVPPKPSGGGDKSRGDLLLRLQLVYQPLLAERDHEQQAELHIYLSTNVSNSVQIVRASEVSSGEVSLRFRLRSPHVIASDCLLNIDQYALHKNEKGELCRNQAGYTNIPLAQLLQVKECRMELHVVNSRDAAHAVKGRVHIKVREATRPVGVLLRDRSEAATRKRYGACASVIADYVRRNRQFYQRYGPTVQSVRNITVFLDQTRVGYLPGSLFDVFRVPKARDEFYLNQLHIAVQRSLGTAERVDLSGRAWLQHPEPAFRVRTTMVMLTVYVNYCTYITDLADHNQRGRGHQWHKELVELIESFDNAFPRDAGDCEDFARCILRLVMEIKYHGASLQSEVMHAVRDILDEFVFCSVLCGVSNRSLSNMPVDGGGDARSGGPKLNGHEGAFAIPKSTFYEALRRDNQDHPILAQLGVPRGTPESSDAGDSSTVYVLEGTGMLQPQPSELGADERRAMRCLASSELAAPVLDSLRSVYHYDPHRTDNFYKMMMACITPEFFLQGVPYVEFLVVYKSACGRKSAGTRGVWFPHLIDIANNPRVTLVSAPPITPELVDAYSMMSKDDYPITRLRGLRETDEMRAFKRALDRAPAPGARTAIGGAARRTFYVRYDQLTEQPRLAEQLAEVATSTGMGIDVRVEPVRTNDNGHRTGGYAVTYYA